MPFIKKLLFVQSGILGGTYRFMGRPMGTSTLPQEQRKKLKKFVGRKSLKMETLPHIQGTKRLPS
jgi:hypothetical protein